MLVSQSCPTLCDPMDCRHRDPLSMRFSKQEYWSGLPFLSPGDLPRHRDQTRVSCTAGRFLTNWATREALSFIWKVPNTSLARVYSDWMEISGLVNVLVWTIWLKWCLRKTDVIIVDERNQLLDFWRWLIHLVYAKGLFSSL